MSDAQYDAMCRTIALLLRLDGIVDYDTPHSFGDASVVDFRIMVTTAPHEFCNSNKRAGVYNSNIDFNPDGSIERFVLRMPPLLGETYDYTQETINVFKMAEEVTDKFNARVYLRIGNAGGGNIVFVPHIISVTTPSNTVLTPHVVRDYLRDLLQLYRERYEWGV